MHSSSSFQINQTSSVQSPPEIGPIDHDSSQFIMTPISSNLIREEINETMEEIILGQALGLNNELKAQPKRKKTKNNQLNQNLSLQIFHISCDLEKIIEKEEEQSSQLSQDESSDCNSSELNSEEDFGYANSNTIATLWNFKLKQKTSNSKDSEEQKQRTIDMSVVDYSQTINRFCQNPRIQITNKIRQIRKDQNYASEEEKRTTIKKYIEKFLLDYELYCYQQSWKQLDSSFQAMIQSLLKGIQQTFTKNIGKLLFQNRRVKLLKYLEKKRRRIWRKKVSYDCRKKVADGRLRIKGKFVTREQACEQLGLQSLDSYSADQIKEMLQRKIDQSLNQLLVC